MLSPVLLHFGQGRDLKIDFGESQGIQQGAGLHRLILPLKILATNNLGSGIRSKLVAVPG
jgi:hypothetical protein